jgi:DNA-binding NtrC family response regulator
MEANNAILIARDDSSADEIQAELSQRTGRTVTICSYDNCRRQIAWHLNGILVLVANDETDYEPLTAVVREHKLRRSNRRIIVLEAGAAANTAAVTTLGSLVSTRLRWPEAADELAKLIGPRSSGDDQGESLSDVLANKLRALTPSLAPMAGRLAVAAMHDVMVLLSGETGTGKTYLAHLLHEHSPRRNERFMIVPCGAQPAELFESTFFGHVKGSFTGAHQTQSGKFACAGKGTILLDEVDSLGFEQQAALLRVIETGEYEMVGSSQTLKSEARLIVASNTISRMQSKKDCSAKTFFIA